MPTLLAPRTWDSKLGLLAHLEASATRTLLLGQGTEAPRNYYSFSVTSGAEIGVISSGLGTEPAAVLLQREQRALVGYDTWVVAIMSDTLAVVATLRLGGVFYEFLPIDSNDEVVLVHEIGVLRIDGSGAVKWSVDSGIVSGCRLDGRGRLIISLMDGTSLAVSLDSGEGAR